MNKKFRRRIYARPGEFLQDFRYMLSHRALIRSATPALHQTQCGASVRELVSPAFRERLMMVVTEVNGCRYCSSYHSRQALTSGVPETELRELLAGSIPQEAPSTELPALYYAQNWAANNAKPDLRSEQHLREVYGAEKAQAIQIILRMIRVGNLLGNTADYLLFLLSFGLLGLRKDETRF